MSALTEVTISCPHCRRQYNMKIDPERLQRLKTRATCGRCGKTFDAASRITAAQQQQQVPLAPPDEPKPVRDEPPPAMVQLKPLLRTSGMTSPDLRDEMEELAREFAEAAARFTPVGIKRSSVGLGGGGAVSSGLEASPPAKPPAVEEPTNPGVTPASILAASSATTTPDLIAIPATGASEVATPPPDSFLLDAEPASDEEFATQVPTLSRVPAVPRSWLEQSDPGLAALQSPPSPGAAALEALLNESETIALPPPPAAS
jgi:hypothetical protein